MRSPNRSPVNPSLPLLLLLAVFPLMLGVTEGCGKKEEAKSSTPGYYEGPITQPQAKQKPGGGGGAMRDL